jgi:hypothetical protein
MRSYRLCIDGPTRSLESKYRDSSIVVMERHRSFLRFLPRAMTCPLCHFYQFSAVGRDHYCLSVFRFDQICFLLLHQFFKKYSLTPLYIVRFISFLQSITRIEVSGCHSVQQFQCRSDQLQELTLCDNHNLISVNFRSSILTKLVLSGSSHLSELECSAQSELMELNLYGCRCVPLFFLHYFRFSLMQKNSICRKLLDLTLQPLIRCQTLCVLNVNGCIGLHCLKLESRVLSR